MKLHGIAGVCVSFAGASASGWVPNRGRQHLHHQWRCEPGGSHAVCARSQPSHGHSNRCSNQSRCGSATCAEQGSVRPCMVIAVDGLKMFCCSKLLLYCTVWCMLYFLLVHPCCLRSPVISVDLQVCRTGRTACSLTRRAGTANSMHEARCLQAGNGMQHMYSGAWVVSLTCCHAVGVMLLPLDAMPVGNRQQWRSCFAR